MNWYIGQEIVCLKSSRDSKAIEGVVYKVEGLRVSTCVCRYILIDIGAKSDSDCFNCELCGTDGMVMKDNNIRWFGESRFKPLDELCDISEITEHLRTTEPYSI